MWIVVFSIAIQTWSFSLVLDHAGLAYRFSGEAIYKRLEDVLTVWHAETDKLSTGYLSLFDGNAQLEGPVLLHQCRAFAKVEQHSAVVWEIARVWVGISTRTPHKRRPRTRQVRTDIERALEVESQYLADASATRRSAGRVSQRGSSRDQQQECSRCQHCAAC